MASPIPLINIMKAIVNIVLERPNTPRAIGSFNLPINKVAVNMGKAWHI